MKIEKPVEYVEKNINLSLTDCDYDLKILPRNIKILAKVCHWVKENASCIIKYMGLKYYLSYSRIENKMVVKEVYK